MPDSEMLAKVKASPADFVLYTSSLPLTSDSVLIQRQYHVLPGLHAFKTVAIIDPAWNPKVERDAGGQTVLTWNDGNGGAMVRSLTP